MSFAPSRATRHRWLRPAIYASVTIGAFLLLQAIEGRRVGNLRGRASAAAMGLEIDCGAMDPWPPRLFAGADPLIAAPACDALLAIREGSNPDGRPHWHVIDVDAASPSCAPPPAAAVGLVVSTAKAYGIPAPPPAPSITLWLADDGERLIPIGYCLMR